MAVPIANIMEPADWQDREMERLEAENAKLRELVRDIWDAYRCEEVAPNVAKHWHDRMRELGVEV